MSTISPPKERFDKRSKAADYGAGDATAIFRSINKMDEPATTPVLLDGGFSNANFHVEAGGKRFVARFYPEGLPTAEREASLLKMAASKGILVPQMVEGPVSIEGKTANIMSFVEGVPLSDRLLQGTSDDLQAIFRSIGYQLGRMHRIKFDKAGLFGAECAIIREFDGFADSSKSFIIEPLKGRAGARLGATLTGKLREVVSRYWSLVAGSYRGPSLVHCDFNPKNLIVNEPVSSVTVLDWEFAMSGDPLIDLGNFLRFEEDYSPASIHAFVDSYEKTAGTLPKEWRLAARLHDLVSMCGFLDSPEEMPKTFRTAKSVIERTLDLLP